MSLPVINHLYQVTMVQNAIAQFAGGFLHLYIAIAGQPNRDTTVSEFTEATYPGYAPLQIPAWSGPYRDVNGDQILIAPSQNFVGPAAGGGPTIQGCWYSLAASGGPLAWCAPLDTPAPLVDASRILVLNCQIDPTGNGWVSMEGSVLP